MKTLLLLFCFFGLAATATPVISGDVAQSGLAEIQAFLELQKPFRGDGEKFGDQLLLEVTNVVSEHKLWHLKAAQDSTTLQISAAAIKKGLSLESWTLLMSNIFNAHYSFTVGLLNHQQVLSLPNALPAEKASVELNSLNLLKDRVEPKSGEIWDVAKAIFDPADRFSAGHTIIRVYIKSIAPIFGDNLERRSDDVKDLWARVEVVATKLATVLESIVKDRQALVNEFNQAQKTISKFRNTSAKVSELVELVAKNDREGVAKILESSLPWDLFTRQETHIYRQFVQAIRSPNKHDAVYLLRGTNPKLDPAPEDTGLMSKLFKSPKFQSLTVNEVFAGYREDWANSAVNKKTDAVFPSFFNLGENHSHSSASIDGHPSALVSTSASAPVVTKFAKGSKVLMRVDARRMYPNFESMMYFEREVLVPFFVFPDEIEGMLVKDPATKKSFIQRTKDQSVNLEATEFYKKNMAKDALALPYIISIWEKSYQQFFPVAMAARSAGHTSTSQCLRFYGAK